MKRFHESDRYDYDLTPESVVIDCGGYEGSFARQLYDKYRCQIRVYEPVRPWAENLGETLGLRTGIQVFPFGLGGWTRMAKIRIKGDSTGLFADSGVETEVEIRSVSEEIDRLQIPTVALLKLNCEGAEFEIMEHVLDVGLALRLENIQVQPHGVVPDAQRRWRAIQVQLAKTHRLTHYQRWAWEMWRKK